MTKKHNKNPPGMGTNKMPCSQHVAIGAVWSCKTQGWENITLGKAGFLD